MSFSLAIDEYLKMYNGGDGGNAFHGLLEMDPAILPELISAYHSETDTQKRCFLLHVIWEYRQPLMIPFLSEVLLDHEPLIWQEAIDGLVALASPEAVNALSAARSHRFTRSSDTATFQLWVAEAIEQAGRNVISTPPPLNRHIK